MDNKINKPLNRRMGVIDIGSNSVRFVIYDLFGAAFTPVYNEKVLAGLGRSLRETGQLDSAGKLLAYQAILRFKILAKERGVKSVLIGATAALREASDAKEFMDDILDNTGFRIKPLSGHEEALMAAQGLIAAEPRAHGIAADLGGASLELVSIDNKSVSDEVSYPIGPFQLLGDDLSRPFDPQDIRQKIRASLQNAPNPDMLKTDNLYLIGGAWRNLFKIHQKRNSYPMKTLQSYCLDRGSARELARWAYEKGRDEAINWPGMNKRRAETLPYSGLVLDELLHIYAAEKVIISTAGLREGLVYNVMSDELKMRDALLDGCRDLARGNLDNRIFGGPLYKFLKEADGAFPKANNPENEERLRKAACYLTGMGKGLHPDYKAKLVFDDVLYAPLVGLTHRERAYLALILFASFTGKDNCPNQAAIDLLLNDSEKRAAKIYGRAIRLAVVASGHSANLLAELSLIFEKGSLMLSANSNYKSLLTQRVHIRLSQLCTLAGLTPILS